MFSTLSKAFAGRRLLVAALASTAVASAGLGASAGSGASAATPSESNLTVNGSGAAFVVPDVANLSIRVSNNASTPTAARSQANRRTYAVLAAIRRAGLIARDIQTAGISLDHFQAGPPVIATASTRHLPRSA